MKVLIVYAHPEPASFNGALKDLAVDVLRDAGHQVEVSDLYALNFDPAGGPGDFLEREDPSVFRYQREQIHASSANRFVPELKAELDKLLWADFVIFQFPLWWFSLPAILKGWVDRVFAMGFAYAPMKSYETGVFRGKRAMLSFTTGGPETTYGPHGKNGSLDELLKHVQYGMLYFVGMDVLPPFVAYSAARVPQEVRAQYLAQFKQRLLALETTPPLEFRAAQQST